MSADPTVAASAGPGSVRRLLGPVAERDFGLLWSARTLSLIGDYTFRIALVTYVISVTGSARGLALATTVLLLPALVFYLVGGVAGDRARSRRRIMVGADLLCALATAAMALAAGSGRVWPVVALAVVIGVGDGFFQPAAFAVIAEIVPAERRMAANSANSLARQLGLVIGPALGGFVVGFWSPAAAFTVDCATFVLSAALVLAIRARVDQRPTGEADGQPRATARRWRAVGADALAGVRFLAARRRLLLVFVVGSVANAVFVGNLDVAIPFVFAPRGVDQAQALGAFYALEGVGAILGAILLTRFTPHNLLRDLLFVLAGMAGSLATAGMLGGHPPGYATALTYGVGLHWFNSLFVTMLHNSVPERLLSRVGSLTFLCFNGLMPLGTLLMGPLVVAVGGRGAAAGTGLGLVAVCLAGTVLMRHIPPPQREEERSCPDTRGAATSSR